MKRVILYALLSQICYTVMAQVTFTASANKVVELGENFRITYSVNANGSNFTPPDFNDFSVLAGPHKSTSSSFQYINGKTSQTITNSYSFIVQGAKVGKFTIGKAKITVEGKSYESNQLTIEVIKGSSNANVNNSNNNTNNDQTISNSSDIFVRTNLNKTTVYQGEQLIATLKIYDRVGLSALNDYKLPSFAGFWVQDVKLPNNIQLTRENVNNKIYRSAKLRQSILFPQKSGTITIEPFEVECVVQEVAGQRRNFFGEVVNVYKDVNKTLKSPSRKVTVLPLPANKPASFTGAVGTNFKFEVSVDRTELKSNESITFKVKVSGNGNLQIIDKINFDFPASFEVFDPKVSNNISNTAAGAKGSKTFEYLVVPREPGTYNIPAVEFGYFDVSSKSYKVLSSKELVFNIEKGENDQLYVSGESYANKAEVEALGSDIRHIVENDFELRTIGSSFYGSVAFYLFYLVGIIAFIILVIVLKNKIKENQNLALQRNKRANKISKKRLKAAAVHMKQGNKEAFYDEVIRALWGYLSDKLNIPVADLSRETVKETLVKKNIDEALISNFVEVIDNCEFAKYAPVTEGNQIEQDYGKARMVINKLVNVL